jgi:hypothetical protein
VSHKNADAENATAESMSISPPKLTLKGRRTAQSKRFTTRRECSFPMMSSGHTTLGAGMRSYGSGAFPLASSPISTSRRPLPSGFAKEDPPLATGLV